jgi:hypothetical protein
MSVGSCVVVNSAIAAFTVSKDFVPNNAATVQIAVTCTSGVISPPNATISEGNPWTFTVTGYSAGASCQATESLIPGYVSTGNCTGVITNYVASCTIVNTQATPSPTPSGTVSPATPTPPGQTPNTAVGGNVVLPVSSGESGGGCCTGLIVMVLVGLLGVVSAGGSLAFSRRNQG